MPRSLRRPTATDEDCLQTVKGTEVEFGLMAIRRLRALLHEREHYFVTRARRMGHPWYVIAFYLGVSTQGVHKRWAKRIEREDLEEEDDEDDLI